jgi:hypothetical protein
MILGDVINIKAGSTSVKKIYVGSTLAYNNEFDSDAAAYITAVEAADSVSLGYSQGLENKVKVAINNFVLGCKSDGIWTAIQSSCIMSGARTIAGALVPLKGPAPTNNSLSTYSRQLGLKGATGANLNTNTTNFIDSNINNGHIAIYTTGTSDTGYAIASDTTLNGSVALRPYNTASSVFRLHSSGGIVNTSTATTGFVGVSRNNSTQANAVFNTASGLVNTTSTQNSATPSPLSNIYVFSRPNLPLLEYSQRITFYSIGTYIDLALLNARLTTLINSFATI